MNTPQFLRQCSRRTGWVITGLAGALTALGQAPVGWPIFLFLGFAILVWQVQLCTSWKPAFRLGWLAGTAHFALVMNWIIEPFLVDIGRHGWMAPFALILMAGGLALFWAGAFAISTAMRGAVPRALLLAAALAGLEWVRGWIFTGLPWALTAYVWADTPVAQTAAFVGPFGLSLVTFALAVLVAVGWRGAAVSGLVVSALWAGGVWRMSEPMQPRVDPVTVRVLQPNAAQHLKWQPEMMPVFYRRLMDMTAEPAVTRLDIVIWPEASAPFMLNERFDLQQEMAIAAGGAQILVGIRRRDPDGAWYNSAALLDRTGAVQDLHDKAHLVPFGEYVPFNDLATRFGIGGLAVGKASGFTAGQGITPMQPPGLPPLLPLVCYEAIFPDALNAVSPRPDWIVLVTNDAWFGRWSGPYQHLAQSQFRAIEQGLPMVRSANTGISAVIDAHGRILQSVPLNQQGWFDAALPPARPATLYRNWGEVPFAVLLILLLAAASALEANTRTRDQGQR
ncbi:apolipoprotein N-acyltransferase [Halovulum sp. GXIMD14793]